MPSWEVHFGLHLMVDHRRIIEDLARIHALAGVIRGIPIPPSAQERLDRLNILRAVCGGSWSDSKFRGGGLQTIREPTYWNVGARNSASGAAGFWAQILAPVQIRFNK